MRALVLCLTLAGCATGSVESRSPCGEPPAKPMPEFRYTAPAPGMTWAPGSWACDGVGYVWVPGHWK